MGYDGCSLLLHLEYTQLTHPPHSPTTPPPHAILQPAATPSASSSAATTADIAATSSAHHTPPTPSPSTKTPISTPKASPPVPVSIATPHTRDGKVLGSCDGRRARTARMTGVLLPLLSRAVGVLLGRTIEHSRRVARGDHRARLRAAYRGIGIGARFEKTTVHRFYITTRASASAAGRRTMMIDEHALPNTHHRPQGFLACGDSITDPETIFFPTDDTSIRTFLEHYLSFYRGVS